VGLVLGVLLLGGARFFFVHPPEPVHFHANFALFVDGQRVDLSGNRYMEDVAACSANADAQRPQDRIHMHNNLQDVVHVHASGATWGHLFANLDMSLGDRHLILDDERKLFEGEEGRTIEFFVNGMQVLELANRQLRSEDRVVISVGPETPDEVLAEQFPQVASNADEFNQMDDPAGCAGAAHEMTFGERLRNAFWGM
jgi:hypothetical protein